ncbi:MAG: hypothetical protein CEE43_18910 [Promethearchaeota archaeon Loki_b32]|nr:MAG: hypothetical protein CEE43_18910 [Candidatus Lokiarchaeota archaeon Loki_b32]
MTEEQSEETGVQKEKEEKRKIRVVEQIDDRLAIQGQAYMKGQLKEAVSLAYEIIELAKPEGMKSFIKEQEELIARIKKILKEKEERERVRIRVEQEKLRLERIKKLKIELSQLEREFNIALKKEDFLNTEEVLENAKNLLTKLDDEKLKTKWEELKNRAVKTKIKKELIVKAEKLIEESIDLKEKYLFDDLKLKLTDLLEQLKDNEIDDYYKEIKAIQSDILNAEKTYSKTVEKIEGLVKKVGNFQDEKKYKNAISNCEELIQHAESIKKIDLVEVYSKLLINLQEDLKFEELKDSVRKLNEESLFLLRKGEIIASLDKFKIIQKSLKQYKK